MMLLLYLFVATATLSLLLFGSVLLYIQKGRPATTCTCHCEIVRDDGAWVPLVVAAEDYLT